jgi:hypothetical protein
LTLAIAIYGSFEKLTKLADDAFDVILFQLGLGGVELI